MSLYWRSEREGLNGDSRKDFLVGTPFKPKTRLLLLLDLNFLCLVLAAGRRWGSSLRHWGCVTQVMLVTSVSYDKCENDKCLKGAGSPLGFCSVATISSTNRPRFLSGPFVKSLNRAFFLGSQIDQSCSCCISLFRMCSVWADGVACCFWKKTIIPKRITKSNMCEDDITHK